MLLIPSKSQLMNYFILKRKMLNLQKSHYWLLLGLVGGQRSLMAALVEASGRVRWEPQGLTAEQKPKEIIS